MQVDHSQAKLLALALYDIRVLLSSHLGSENDSPLHIREAAHLAYSLHNQALAVIAGEPFDVTAALQSVAAPASFLGTNYALRYAQELGSEA